MLPATVENAHEVVPDDAIDLYQSSIEDAQRKVLKEHPDASPGLIRAKTRELALQNVFVMGDDLNRVALRILRDMEMELDYVELGYTSLKDWAYSQLEHLRNRDTLSRLCNIVTRMVKPLDQNPVIDPDTGEIVNGLTMIEKASPSALMKTSQLFAEANETKKSAIVGVLMTGTSDHRRVKQAANGGYRLPPLVLVFKETGEVNEKGEAIIEVSGRITYSQEIFLSNQLGDMLDARMVQP